jgi:hypothetical protein
MNDDKVNGLDAGDKVSNIVGALCAVISLIPSIASYVVLHQGISPSTGD